jgi:hypothetical protein
LLPIQIEIETFVMWGINSWKKIDKLSLRLSWYNVLFLTKTLDSVNFGIDKCWSRLMTKTVKKSPKVSEISKVLKNPDNLDQRSWSRSIDIKKLLLKAEKYWVETFAEAWPQSWSMRNFFVKTFKVMRDKEKTMKICFAIQKLFLTTCLNILFSLQIKHDVIAY